MLSVQAVNCAPTLAGKKHNRAGIAFQGSETIGEKFMKESLDMLKKEGKDFKTESFSEMTVDIIKNMQNRLSALRSKLTQDETMQIERQMLSLADSMW